MITPTLTRHSICARIVIAAAFITLAAAPISASSRDSDADAGLAALKKGGVEEARGRLANAVRRSPSRHDWVIAYITTLPPRDALRLTDSLSRAKRVPARVRAQCLKILGDHRFIKEDYKNAAEFYNLASRTDSASLYRYHHALALAMDGRVTQAAAIWRAIAADKSDTMSTEAARIIAQLTPAAAPTASVLPPVQTTPAVSAPARQPAPTTPTVSTPAQQPVSTQAPAQRSTPTTPAPTQQAPTPAQRPAPTTPVVQQAANTIFTVQVGAFGSKENADNLVRRLSETYKDVTVVQATSGDQTLYRVRIGTFQKREDAAAFADKLINESGMTARVVEK